MASPGPADPESELPLLPKPYTKEEAIRYWDYINDRLDKDLDAADLDALQSGFPWYPIPKLEHLLVNLRHIQHHAAQLADRVRMAADQGVQWRGSFRQE